MLLMVILGRERQVTSASSWELTDKWTEEQQDQSIQILTVQEQEILGEIISAKWYFLNRKPSKY